MLSLSEHIIGTVSLDVLPNLLFISDNALPHIIFTYSFIYNTFSSSDGIFPSFIPIIIASNISDENPQIIVELNLPLVFTNSIHFTLIISSFFRLKSKDISFFEIDINASSNIFPTFISVKALPLSLTAHLISF
jgi:hypothetical protein